MNTSDTIENLFKLGVASPIQIGVPPDGKFAFFASGKMGIPTGDVGNQIVVDLQSVGDSLSQCLERMTEQVEGVNTLKKVPSGIIKMPTSGRLQ